MASHGGDDGEPWGGSPATERVGSAYQDDDPVTVRNERPEQFGRTTDKSWSPGASGPPTRPADHGAPVAIFDGPTSGGDDDANVTQRRFAIRDRHGTMPMDQVLVPSEQPPTPPPPATVVRAHAASTTNVSTGHTSAFARRAPGRAAGGPQLLDRRLDACIAVKAFRRRQI